MNADTFRPFEMLNKDARLVAGALAVTEKGIPLIALRVVNPFVPMQAAVLTRRAGKNRLLRALNELIDAGYADHDTDNDLIGLYPPAREAVLNTLGEDERRALHDRAYVRLSEAEGDSMFTEAHSETVGNAMEWSIAVYLHAVAIGEQDTAARYFLHRLSSRLRSRHMYTMLIDLLLRLFPDRRSDAPPLVGDTALNVRVLKALGDAYSALNAIDDAVRAHTLALKVTIDGVWDMMDAGWVMMQESSVTLLGPCLDGLGLTFLKAGRMAASLQAFELAHAMAAAVNDRDALSLATLRLAILNVYLGRWDLADYTLSVFFDMPRYDRPKYWRAEAERVRIELLYSREAPRDVILAALDAADEAARLGENALSADVLKRMRCEVWMEDGRAEEAVPVLRALAARAAKAGTRQNTRGALARALVLTGDVDGAVSLLDAGCDPYSTAVVLHASGEKAAAGDIMLGLYRDAWADGEPFVRRVELNAAEKLLREWGVPIPALPPFDEDRRTVPYADRVRALIAQVAKERSARARDA